MRTVQIPLRDYPNGVVELLYLASDLYQLRDRSFKMLRNHIHNCNIASCSRRREHKCSRFDLIRNNRILRSVQTLYAAYLDHIRSRASDVRSHAVQEVRHIYYMRLLRHILHNSQAFRHRSSHHHIDRRSYTDHIEVNVLAYQTVCLCNDLSMPDLHICSQSPEALKMLVDRPASDITSSRKRNLRMLILPKQCSQKIIRCPDLLNIIVFNIYTVDVLSINLDSVTIHSANPCSYPLNRIQ